MTHDAPRDATETDADARIVFRDRGEIIAALTARNAELEATVNRIRALGDSFADDGIARYGGNIAWHIEEVIANDKGDFSDAADQRIASQRERADAAEATLTKVAALADKWAAITDDDDMTIPWPVANTLMHKAAADLRAALASAGRPATSDGEDANGEAWEYGVRLPDGSLIRPGIHDAQKGHELAERWPEGEPVRRLGWIASPVVAPSATDEHGA